MKVRFQGKYSLTNYEELSQVNDEFLALRDIVMSKKKPRRVFVQPHTKLNGQNVEYQNFDATPEGLISSFVARFEANL